MSPTSEQVNDVRGLLRRYIKPTGLIPAERIGRESNTQIYLELETELEENTSGLDFEPLNRSHGQVEMKTIVG